MGSGGLLLPFARGLAPRRARPSALRVATGLALAAAGALLVTLIRAADHGPGTGDGPGEVVRVGVVEGQSVPGYLDSSRGELAALVRAPGAPGETWALVSLTAYEPPGRLPSMLGGAAVAQVYARAPLVGAPTPVLRIPAYRLPDDVVAGMQSVAAARDRERADYARLGRQLTGSDPDDLRLRRAYADAAAVAGAEASAYRSDCSCVFAAVVRGAPVALDRIAARAGVRAVDPAPEVRALDRAEFRPPLPEQQTVVPVEIRAVVGPTPSPRRPVAPPTPTPLPSSSGAAVASASPGCPARGSGPSAAASEEGTAVSCAPATSPGRGVPSLTAGASRGPSGR
jgi:hypothetical protein